MICHAKESTLKIHGMQMDYITFGKGKKSLVIIQGLNTRGIKGMAIPLACMYRIFAGEHKVFLFDRRRDIPEGVTVRDLAADTARAMDALGIAGADVFGVSQGGMIAQYLAIDRPDLVKKLVLAVTASRNNATVEAVVHQWIELVERGDMGSFVADMAAKMYSDAYVKRYRPLMPLLTVLQRPKDVQRFVRLAKACLTCNTYPELDKIRCPVLVIGGKRDQVVTGEASREIAEKLGCRSYLYEHLGHALYEEAKDFNRRIYDFLQEQTEIV